MQKLTLFAGLCLMTACHSQTRTAPSARVVPTPSFVTVYGHVVHPGRIPWTPGLTLEAALSTAGGIAPPIYSQRNGDIFPGDIRISEQVPGTRSGGKEIARIRCRDFDSRAKLRHRRVQAGQLIGVSKIYW